MTEIATARSAESWACAPGDTLLPGYRAVDLLGDGVRCETWLCWSDAHLSLVAVKLPRPVQLTSNGAHDAIRREASALRHVHHPALPRLIDAQPDAPIPHLVTELAEGPTLSALVDEDGPFDREEVILIGIQLAVALHHLHTSAGLVHLDVTPGNVVLRDGRPVLLDLGIASAIGAPARPGPARGTPGYMSPEQRRRRPATPAMDVYALGVTLRELLRGTPTPKRPSSKRRAEPEADPRPGSLAATLAELCRELPASRPASAWDAARRLDAHLDGDDRPVPAFAW